MRSRPPLLYLTLAIAVIALGLASRWDAISPPDFVALYVGDALWALMVYLLLCTLFTKTSTSKLFPAALVFCFGIELSQLYQASWINELRAMPLVGLVLGFGFVYSDLAAYAVGIFTGAMVDLALRKWLTKKHS